MYYIITSKKKEKILVSEDLRECFNFIVKFKDAQIRSIDHTAKPKIFNKKKFIVLFLELTEDEEKSFFIMKRLIKGENNIIDFLRNNNLSTTHKAFKKKKIKFI